MSYDQKKAAFEAWNKGKCSDEELALCIKSLGDAIETMHALKAGSIIISGMHLLSHSMENAMYSRKLHIRELAS